MVSFRSFRHSRGAFSLMEVLMVVSIISMVAGVSLPALQALNGQSVRNGGRLLAGWLSLARSEAIARHTLVRVAIAEHWQGKQENNLRKVSLWAWDSEAEQFFAISPWQELPQGVILESSTPTYLDETKYAQEDPSAVRGDYVLEQRGEELGDFDASMGGETVRAKYIEFTAAGSARVPAGSARNAILVLTPGFQLADGSIRRTTNANGHAGNWAQLNVDKFTGRVRVYQP